MGQSFLIRLLVGAFILPPVALVLAAPIECQGNIFAVQRDALVSLYAISGGQTWTNNSGWLGDANCTYLNTSLPSYCCWAGVSCCISASNETDSNETDSSMCAQYKCNCHVGTVVGLALGRNNLRGALLQDILSPRFLDVMACSLRILFLGGNDLNGTIPENVDTLQDLRIVSFSSNNLTGQIPVTFSNIASLEELDMANNLLTGSVPPGLCGFYRLSHLRDLVLSNNNLTGNLSLPDCESLIYLDVQNNNLEGSFPNLSQYRQLHILRLGNNNFSGPVSINQFTLRLLVMLDLSLNSFSGPLPDFVGQSSQLTLVRVFNNSFTGTISPDIFTVGTLGTFSAYNNLIKGTLPENIGNARGISSISFRGNFIYGTLPDSLRNLGYNGGTVDVSLTNMSCCGDDFDVENTTGYKHFNLSAPRLPPFLELSDLSRPVVDSGVNLVNMRCPFVIVKPEYTFNQSDTFLTWALDPQYFLYEGCTCLEGYNEAWSQPPDGQYSMGPVLVCVRVVNPWYIRAPWAVVLIVLGGLLVGSWLTYLMCFRKGKNAAIVQNVLNMRKRIKGEPIGGQVSIVVTDIEGYSDLMKQSPQLMTRALNLHNAIIRKSRWNNFGYTLEQEGDSYALVFYDAHDAVVFCLQTQLALNKQTWPEGLFGSDTRDTVSKRRQQAPSLLNAISVMTNNLTHSLFGGRAAIPGQGGEGSSTALAAGSGAPGTRGTSMDCRVDSCQTRFGVENSSTLAPGVAALQQEASSVVPVLAVGAASKGHLDLFNGLRVRMGIATGQLPPGTSSKGSAVMDMAKVVSDAANGGQILMDETTFKNVKERIEEFGAVDHNGMNFKKLNAIKPPWYSCLNRKHHRNSEDALLLDMGEYTHCPGCKRLPLFQLEATPGGDTPGGSTGVAPPVTPKGRRGKGVELMRLYQLVPPALVARAKVFGNKITVKDEWYCSDDPYFAAPGTLDAPLGLVEGPVALPPITMAFAIVEGGKTFAARNRRDVRRVNDVCAACIRACLRVVPGGYLCRLQDGDLKYMVAFATPQAALEWALMLQDVLLYADWPETALKYWREEYDDRGRMLFRGPRMKIGLCEGSPRSIIPDHIGRADYHGASVNQAARYMDAAAHGGMIAVEATLVVKVMDAWRETAAAAEAGAVAAAATAEAAAVAVERLGASTVASAFAAAGASAAAAVAAGAAGASGSSTSAKLSRPVGSGSVVEAGRSAGSTGVPTPSRGGSRKGRMAAVQEADACEEHPHPTQSAAAAPHPAEVSAVRVHVPAASPPANSPSLPPRPRPPPGAASAASVAGAGAHSGFRVPGTGPRTHVSFAAAGGDHPNPALASHPIVTSGDSAVLSPLAAPRQRSASSAGSGPAAGPVPAAGGYLGSTPSSSAAAAAPPPLGFTAAAVAAVALSGRRPHASSMPGSLPEVVPIASVASASATSFATGATQLSPSPSSIRSPRPPLLTPLALPTEREREESLRTERAAVEASRRVSVDGPADARYKAHVLAYRIGVFRFKGNPEPIQMAHVVLEHLAARRFPADAPKGKGAKVGDASGLLDECETSLPDLAAIMRDRYMLISGPAHRFGFGAAQSAVLDVNRSSPSNRRVRALLTSSSMGANAVQGSYSPRVGGAVSGAAGSSGSGGSPLRTAAAVPKSRSMAARLGGGGGSGSTQSHDGGGESPSSGAGGPAGPAPPSGGMPRRGGHLMSQLANFATASLRRTLAKGNAGDHHHDAPAAAAAEPAVQLEMGPQPGREAAAGQEQRRSVDAAAAAAAAGAVAVDVGSLEPTISVALVAQDEGAVGGNAAAVPPPPPPPPPTPPPAPAPAPLPTGVLEVTGATTSAASPAPVAADQLSASSAVISGSATSPGPRAAAGVPHGDEHV